ncbi:MAG: hypothetical protein GY927_18925 [bacterium]|nr:hypothetical protein [bacterium]
MSKKKYSAIQHLCKMCVTTQSHVGKEDTSSLLEGMGKVKIISTQTCILSVPYPDDGKFWFQHAPATGASRENPENLR